MDNSEVVDLYQTKSNTDYAYGGLYIHAESIGLGVKGEWNFARVTLEKSSRESMFKMI